MISIYGSVSELRVSERRVSETALDLAITPIGMVHLKDFKNIYKNEKILDNKNLKIQKLKNLIIQNASLLGHRKMEAHLI